MNRRLQTLIGEVLESLWAAAPSAATLAGVHDFDHLLADFDAAVIDERARTLSRHRRELDALMQRGPITDPAEAIDASLLDTVLRVETRLIADLRLPFRDPALYLEEILYGVYSLVHRDFAPLEERARSLAGRLERVPRCLDQAETNLARPGEVPPAWVSAALQLVDGSLRFLGEVEREIVDRAGAAAGALRKRLRGAVRRIREFDRFVRERLSAASGDFAIGRDLFDFLLRVQHGLDLDADGLHDLGADLIRRTREDLEREARSFDPDRSWQELLAIWSADHPPRPAILGEYRDMVERARAFVETNRIATIPAGERLNVEETPAFQRALCPFAAYMMPGPFERKRDAVFWVTTPEEADDPARRNAALREHLRAAIPLTCVHEGYPGHHLQLAVAVDTPSRLRRHFMTPVLVEGWAFYCEEMMAEQGFYDDPRTRVLQLKNQLWRACRVVIDVGLQTRGMGLDEAASMLHEVARLERHSAQGEVLRYARSATQPMSYAVGKQAILDLREAYRRRRGSAFSMREFHDRFLSFASIPIALIREGMLGNGSVARTESPGS